MKVKKLNEQVDIVFNDLNARIRDRRKSRSMWCEGVQTFLNTISPLRTRSLSRHKQLTEYVAGLKTALNESADVNTAIVRFKQRIKDIIYDIVSDVTGVSLRPTVTSAPAATTAPAAPADATAPEPAKRSRTRTPRNSEQDPTNPWDKYGFPLGTPPHGAAAKLALSRFYGDRTTEPASAPTTATAEPTTATTEPEPPPVPTATTSSPAPDGNLAPPVTKAASPTPSALSPVEPEPEAEEDKLAAFGLIIKVSKQIFGKDLADLDDQETSHAIERAENFIKRRNIPLKDDEKEKLVNLARKYYQEKSDTSVGKSPEAEPMTGPTLVPEPERGTGKEPETAANPTEPKISTPKKEKPPDETNPLEMHHIPFANYVRRTWGNNVADYLGNKFQAWGSKKKRQEVLAYLETLPKKESLQYTVAKFTEMLRREHRPEILLHESVKLPLSERVKFYKQKLNSRGM